MPRARRLVRLAGVVAAALFGLVGIALAGAVAFLQGERLADLIAGQLNGLRGRVEVKSVRWRARALLDLVTDAPTPIVIEGLRIVDPDGTPVLVAPRLEVSVPPRSAIGARVFLHDLKLGHGSFWRFADLKDGSAIGFLAAFEPKDAPPRIRAAPETVAEPAGDGDGGLVLQIVNADLDGFTAAFDFPGAWGLELRDIKAPATFILDGDFVGWDVQDLDARGGGFLKIVDDTLPFDRVQVERVATTREWPNGIFLHVEAARTGRSVLTAKGMFNGIYGYRGSPEPAGIDMHAEIAAAGDALTAVAARRGLTGLTVGGDARIVADLKDAFAELNVAATFSGLDVAFDAREARDLGFGLDVELEPLRIAVKDFSLSAPDGGRLALELEFTGNALDTTIKLERLSTRTYVPPALAPLAAGKLDGRLRARASLGDRPSVRLDPIDLRFARTGRGPLPASVGVRGSAFASAERVSTAGLAVRVPGAEARVRGSADVVRRTLEAALRVATTDAAALLRSQGLPALVGGAEIAASATGSWTRPRVAGSVSVRDAAPPGRPDLAIPGIAARFDYSDGTLRLDGLRAASAVAAIEGSGELRLARQTLDHLLRSPLLAFKLDGRDVDLGALLGAAWLQGRVSFTLGASGPLDRVRATLSVPGGAEIVVLGHRWVLAGIEIEADRSAAVVRLLRAERAGGGQLSIEGRLVFRGGMAWTIKIDDVPLAAIPGVGDAPVPVLGRLSVDLGVGGTPAQPTANGTVRLAGLSVAGIPLGGAAIAFASLRQAITIKGRLFDRFDVDGQVDFDTRGPAAATATVAFSDLVLEDLTPAMRAHDGRGRASGQIAATWRRSEPPEVEARLTALDLSLTRDGIDPGGNPVKQRIWLRNAKPLRVVVRGERILADDLRLATEGGEFRLDGGLDGERLGAQITGRINLDLLSPLLRDLAEGLTGEAAMDLKIAGTLSDPRVEGVLEVARPIRFRAPALGGEVEVPSGTLRLGAGEVELRKLVLSVDGAALILEGRAGLGPKFVPTTLDVALNGEVNAALLEALLPGAVTDASGRARVKAQLGGTLAKPSVAARVDLGEIALRLRGFGPAVAIEGGALELGDREVVLRDVKVRLDDQGLVTLGASPHAGRVEVLGYSPSLEIGAVSLPLRGERVGYRAPGAVEIDDVGFALELKGDLRKHLGLAGDVRIVSGRYVQDFTVQNLVLRPSVNESSSRSPMDDSALLRGLGLDLRVRTVGDSFVIQNNLAPEIYVIMDLRVRGTLGTPRIVGEIRPTDGRFRIIGLRGNFELLPNVNHITFVETKSIPAGETPELNLEAQALVTDVAGVEHDVRMRIRGPVGQAEIDLSSASGLDRNQTLLLLLSGRTADDINRLGTRDSRFSTNVGTGADVVGQLSRDMMASLVEPYIDDPLQILTGGIVNLRPTVGADGVEVRANARFGRQLTLDMSWLRDFQGQTRWRMEGNLWTMDYVALRGYYQNITYRPQQAITETQQSVNLQLSLDFPLR